MRALSFLLLVALVGAWSVASTSVDDRESLASQIPSALASALVDTAVLPVPFRAMPQSTSRFQSRNARIHLAKKKTHSESELESGSESELDAEAEAEVDSDAAPSFITKGFVYYDAKKNAFSFHRSLHGGNYYHGAGCAASDDPTDGSKASLDCSGLVSWGAFNSSIAVAGHDQLSVDTSARYADTIQAYGAGYLEGALTADRTFEIIRAIVRSQKRSRKFHLFLELQDIYLRRMALQHGGVKTAPPYNPHAQRHYTRKTGNRRNPFDSASSITEATFWYHVGLALNQMDGMLAGYNAVQPKHKHITLIDLWSINDDGDLLDIERAVGDGIRGFGRFSTVKDLSRQQLLEMLAIRGHCSALIKWTGSDLMVAHATWSDYLELVRMYKHLNLRFRHPSVKSRKVSYSSYAGMVWSSDDYYILDTGLVVLETTLNILDESLYTHVDPQHGVVAWIRNLIANRVSSSGEQWVSLFSKYNSGTYNNQWMVVDYNKFRPGSATLQAGTLWVLEQIPGYVESRDVTPLLQADTYWGSYNLPVFAEINKRSMFKAYAKKHGEVLKYKRAPRGKIFAREQSSITDINGMKKVMRYNKYQTDPESEGCPGQTIAARHDLPSLGKKQCDVTRRLNGATDAKITTYQMARHHAAWLQTGPTHDDQKPFDWTQHQSHAKKKPSSLPDRYTFGWGVVAPPALALPTAVRK